MLSILASILCTLVRLLIVIYELVHNIIYLLRRIFIARIIYMHTTRVCIRARSMHMHMHMHTMHRVCICILLEYASTTLASSKYAYEKRARTYVCIICIVCIRTS